MAVASPAGYLPRLRDPVTDRPVRDPRRPVEPRTVVIMDGPFLLTDPAGLDVVVHLQVSSGALTRTLPSDRQWWIEAYQRYRTDETPAARADAVIAYDRTAAPAIAWRILGGLSREGHRLRPFDAARARTPAPE